MERGLEGAPKVAEDYLRKAVEERPEDPVLLAALGYVEQEHHNDAAALGLYRRALKNDPFDNDAATNLGILEARSGNLQGAVKLWQAAFERVPHRRRNRN